jgi:hypothetical protein
MLDPQSDAASETWKGGAAYQQGHNNRNLLLRLWMFPFLSAAERKLSCTKSKGQTLCKHFLPTFFFNIKQTQQHHRTQTWFEVAVVYLNTRGEVTELDQCILCELIHTWRQVQNLNWPWNQN